MTTIALQVGPYFASGTTLNAYLRSAFVGDTRNNPGGTAPPVAATSTAVVDSATVVTFTGLADGTAYWVGTGSNPYNYVQAVVSPAPVGATPSGAAGGSLAGTYPNPTFAAGAVTNTEVGAAAAIAYSKLALTGAILNADLAGSIAPSKITGTGAVLADVTTITANTQTASYTLVIADAGKAIEMNLGTATVLTIPPNATVAFPIGTVIEVVRLGAGTVTITPGAGVTLPNRLEAAGTTSRTLPSQFSTASLRQRAINQWVLAGDIA